MSGRLGVWPAELGWAGIADERGDEDKRDDSPTPQQQRQQRQQQHSSGVVDLAHASFVLPSPTPSGDGATQYKQRYAALRLALRRQEGELERGRAERAELEAELRTAAEEWKKEQSAAQQLAAQLAQLHEDSERLRLAAEQCELRQRQTAAERRLVESQLADSQSQCGRLQSELEQQYGALHKARQQLLSATRRHLHDESAQQQSVQRLTRAVDELREEAAGREAEREQLLSDMQRLRDAVQILQHTREQQEQRVQPPSATAHQTNGTSTPSAAPTRPLFLSPLVVSSPSVDLTPSASTSHILHLSPEQQPPALHVAAALCGASVLISPLASQLLHADGLSSPQIEQSDWSSASQSSRPSSSPPRPTAVAVSSVSPLSPFSADDFPPLPSSPAVLPAPRSVWEQASQRRAGQRDKHTHTAPRQNSSAPQPTTAPSTSSTGSGDCGASSEEPPEGDQQLVRSLRFAGAVADEIASPLFIAPTTPAPALSSTPAQPPLAAVGSAHSCSLSCSSCQRHAPLSSILIPGTYDTPGGLERTLLAGSSSFTDSEQPSTASSAECSSCRLRATSALLTPVSSSQRSLAVLDSEFRRVKRWTAQLQQQITKQQQQQSERVVTLRMPEAASTAISPREPLSAAVDSQPTRRTSVSRPRSSSEPSRSSLAPLQPSTRPPHRLTVTAAGLIDHSAFASLHTPQPVLSPAPPGSAPLSVPASVSVSSLLVQLSLCESELTAKDASLQAAAQHIAALHDRLSGMADSIEQLEAGMDEHNQRWQLQRSSAKEARGREKQAWAEEVQAAEERLTQAATQCAALHAELSEARGQAASQQTAHSAQRAEWASRCTDLQAVASELQAAVELHSEQRSRLRAELDTANALIEQLRQAAKWQAERAEAETCGGALEGGSTEDSCGDTASPPMLQLVEQQLWEEMSELQQVLDTLII